jgi:hypothetical protein
MIRVIAASFALVAAQAMPPVKAPSPVPAANAVTETAQAVYLADLAAKRRGRRSEAAVLGTAHLSSLPDDFDGKRLQPLIDRLKAWAPGLRRSSSGRACRRTNAGRETDSPTLWPSYSTSVRRA